MPKNANKVEIIKVSFSDTKFEDFLRLPWKFQAKDPMWVPPILSAQKNYLNPKKGWFYEIGKVQLFLAVRNGEAVGRISAQTNILHDQKYQDNTGFFGFFECEDNQETANALLDAAADWLKKDNRKKILGPLSLSIYDEVGCLIEGFDSLPAIMHSHNPPYYSELLKGWGMNKAIDWYALWLGHPGKENLPGVRDLTKRLEDIIARHDMKIVKPKGADIKNRRKEVFDLFNETWASNWGHIPFTWRQFNEILDMMRPLLRPDLIRLVTDVNNELVAFIVTIPDLNPELQTMNGNINFWGYLKLFYASRFKALRRVRTVLLGVKRKCHGKSLQHALINSTYMELLKHAETMSGCDCSLIPENLTHHIKTLTNYGAKHYKTFRLFERNI